MQIQVQTQVGFVPARVTARLRTAGPTAVTQHAASLDEAFRGASDKLKRLIENTLGRLHNHRDRGSIRTDPGFIAE